MREEEEMQEAGGLGRGAIARCSRGQLGLITVDEPTEVTYPDGNTGIAWVGIHLAWGEGVKPGDPWSSRNPTKVADLADLG